MGRRGKSRREQKSGKGKKRGGKKKRRGKSEKTGERGREKVKRKKMRREKIEGVVGRGGEEEDEHSSHPPVALYTQRDVELPQHTHGVSHRVHVTRRRYRPEGFRRALSQVRRGDVRAQTHGLRPVSVERRCRLMSLRTGAVAG